MGLFFEVPDLASLGSDRRYPLFDILPLGYIMLCERGMVGVGVGVMGVRVREYDVLPDMDREGIGFHHLSK